MKQDGEFAITRRVRLGRKPFLDVLTGNLEHLMGGGDDEGELLHARPHQPVIHFNGILHRACTSVHTVGHFREDQGGEL